MPEILFSVPPFARFFMTGLKYRYRIVNGPQPSYWSLGQLWLGKVTHGLNRRSAFPIIWFLMSFQALMPKVTQVPIGSTEAHLSGMGITAVNSTLKVTKNSVFLEQRWLVICIYHSRIFRFLTLLWKFSTTKTKTLKFQTFLTVCTLFRKMLPLGTSPPYQLNH